MPPSRTLPALLAFLLLPGLAAADTIKWVGVTNDDWHEASNWDPAVVPSPGDDVFFFNYGILPAVLSADATVRSLTLVETGSLTIGAGSTLTLEDGVLSVGQLSTTPGHVTGGGTLRTLGNCELHLEEGTFAVPLVVGPGVTLLSQSAIPIGSSILVEGTFDLGTSVPTVTGFPFHVEPGGVLRGGETAILPASALVIRGRIETGASPGRLVVNGAINVQLDGAIEIEIAGPAPVTQHDRLVVTGNFKMRDTLRVVMRGAYTPSVGDEFHVLSFGSRNSTFQHVVVVPGNPLTTPIFSPVYDDTSLTLVVTSVLGVGDGNDRPAGLSPAVLFAPTPNPTLVSTSVGFELASTQAVRLEVFDAGGRRVRVLAEETLAAGRHQRTWDGRDRNGDRVVPGVYLVRLEAGPWRQARRIAWIGG